MFKKIVSFVLCIVACFSLFACNEPAPSPTPEVSITLSETATSVEMGNQKTITATVTGSSSSVTWSFITGSEYATITANGNTVTVRGTNQGTAVLSAALSGKVATCVVTVTSPATTIIVTPNVVSSLEVGSTTTLTATTNPAGKTVTWNSSNPAIATVNNGVVTGVSAGQVRISATAEGVVNPATCTVTVVAPPITISLNKTSETLQKNNTLTLIATVGGTTNNVTWSSSNLSVANVSSSGNNCTVTAVGDGTATITAAIGSVTATCVITVNTPVPVIHVDTTTFNLNLGATAEIDATFENQGDNAPVYTSNKPSYVTVDEDGVIRVIKASDTTVTAKITITLGDATPVTITVKVGAVSLELDSTSKTLNVGDTYDLMDIITVTNYNGALSFSSNKSDCASVSRAGLVNAIGVRTVGSKEKVTITIAIPGADLEDYFTVNINAPKPELNITTPTLAVGVAQTATIGYTTLNTTSSNYVSFSSANPNVATVDYATGVVTGVAEGTATINVVLSGATPITKTVTVNVSASVLPLSEQNVTLNVGQTKVITASTSDPVTWTSNNNAVATVNGGIITALSAGTATITATAGGRTGTCQVTVNASMAINEGDIEISIDEEFQLTVSNAPGAVTWTSDDDSIAEVDQEGYVYGVDAGTTTITASAGGQTASVEVTVRANMSINKTTLTLTVGGTDTLTVSNAPGAVTWTSNKTGIATVSNGVVTGLAAGTATITAASGGQSVKCQVTVKAAMTIDKTTASMNIGQSLDLFTTNAPGIVNWTSSNTSVAAVDPNGMYNATVTAISAGQTTITGTASGQTVSCVITVAENMTINQTALTLLIDQTYTLVVENAPSTVVWSSNNQAVATVDQSGVVRGLSQGDATITATSGGQSVSCQVHVRGTLVMNKGTESLKVDGGTVDIYVIGNEGNVSWTVDDSTKVTLTPNGVSCTLTPVAVGTATVTATDLTTMQTATCEITITEAGGDDPEPPVPQGDDSKIQIFIHNFDGGYGSAWLAQLKERFETQFANYTDSQNPGKVGIELLITPQKTGIMNMKEKIATNTYDIYFNEYAEYYTLVKEGCIREITDAINEQIGYESETKSIKDKLTKEQQEYFGMKQTDGSTKYYGIPHYAGYAGINYNVKLFDDKGLYYADDYDYDAYLAGEIEIDDLFVIDGYSSTRSPGPDGDYGTIDDGLPTTYDEFYTLCEYISSFGIQPVDWTGHDRADYTTYLLVALAADYEGLDQIMLNYTNSGTATNLARIVNGQLVIDSTPTVITEQNGYELARQAGKYYALDFLRKIATTKNYHGAKCMNSSYSHMDCQTNFVMSAADSSYQKTAMIVEGNWWENEANDTFSYMVQKYGSDYSKYNAHFAMMPLPQATRELADARANGESIRTLYDQINSICCVKSGLAQSKWNAVKEFLKFAHTDKSLIEYSVSTNTLKAFEYQIPANELAKMTKYGQSIYEAKYSSNIAVPNSSNDLYVNNTQDFFYTVMFRSFLSGQQENRYPLNAFDEKGTTTAEYFTGMYAFWQYLWDQNEWGQQS